MVDNNCRSHIAVFSTYGFFSSLGGLYPVRLLQPLRHQLQYKLMMAISLLYSTGGRLIFDQGILFHSFSHVDAVFLHSVENCILENSVTVLRPLELSVTVLVINFIFSKELIREILDQIRVSSCCLPLLFGACRSSWLSIVRIPRWLNLDIHSRISPISYAIICRSRISTEYRGDNGRDDRHTHIPGTPFYPESSLRGT